MSIERQKWVDHKFNLEIDPGWSRNVVTRISDITFRCEYHCSGLSEILLTHKLPGQWSIKEHIGHLIDLEELHINRLKEFSELKTELSAADMSNQKTEETDHNATTLTELLEELYHGRGELIATFSGLSDEALHHKSKHPRLMVAMRPVDLMFFIGEHDDHHLATMLDIKSKLD